MPDPCGTSYFLFFCSWPGHFKSSKRPAFAFMAVCCVLLLTKKLLCPVHNIQPTSIMRRSAVFKNRQRSYYSPISFMHILFCCCIRRNLYGYNPPRYFRNDISNFQFYFRNPHILQISLFCQIRTQSACCSCLSVNTGTAIERGCKRPVYSRSRSTPPRASRTLLTLATLFALSLAT